MKRTIGLITCNYSVKTPSSFTESRPVASMPFLGRYRLVDFALSNMVNGGIQTVGVIMPYNYRSLIDHIGSGKDWNLDRKNGGLFILPGSAFGTSRTGSRFLIRDLIANKQFLKRDDAEHVILSSANFVYNGDMRKYLAQHIRSGADISVLTKVSVRSDTDVSRFQVEGDRVTGVGHGIQYGDCAFIDCFIIKRELLLNMLDWYSTLDYLDFFEAMEHDFDRVDVRAIEFEGYVAGIFNRDTYYKASMELLDPQRIEELFPEGRHIKTKAHDNAPAKYEVGSHVTRSLVSGGCRLYGSVCNSVLGRSVIVEPGATVKDAIIMQGCVIKSGARVEYAIVDRNNVIPAGTELRGTPKEVLIKEKGRD